MDTTTNIYRLYQTILSIQRDTMNIYQCNNIITIKWYCFQYKFYCNYIIDRIKNKIYMASSGMKNV
jgi:hypothetical protein